MTLLEALEIIKSEASQEFGEFRAFLACGFTPLHFEKFLCAALRKRRPQQRVTVSHAVFGDLAGSLENLPETDVVAVALEWPDLDGRLSVRAQSKWSGKNLPDILEQAQKQLQRIYHALKRIEAPVVICLPTLPLPPLAISPLNELSSFDASLRATVAEFARSLTGQDTIRVISAQQLDTLSPIAQRYEVASDLAAGFPYSLAHASALAELFASNLRPHQVKKGLITDLDDTLWRGIVGEIGPDQICWSLDRNAQVHGLYQNMLASLAEAGVLIGIASKNSPEVVEQAFLRDDLLLTSKSVFPIEANWKAKSASVGRILQAWNIGAEAVVFVDDNALEVAEVQAAYPEMQCMVFPGGNPKAAWELICGLRALFGKRRISEEDTLRLESLRQGAVFTGEAAANGSYAEELLRDAQAELSLSFGRSPGPRALELINKTNQFNLNGKRLSESEWPALLNEPDVFALTASYTDRFGRLGTIAVAVGRLAYGAIHLEHWVMSCRAFSRRIEHRCLQEMFQHLRADRIHFDFTPTSRNTPLREFLSSVAGAEVSAPFFLSLAEFQNNCPPLYQQVEILTP